METIETVFGTDEKDPTVNMPDFALTAFKSMIDEYDLGEDIDKTQFKQKVVDLFNSKALGAIKEDTAKWVAIVRSTRAALNGLYATSEQTPMLYEPYSVQFTPLPIKDKKDEEKIKSYSVKTFGMARSLDEEAPFEGPAYLWVTDFEKKDVAEAFIAAFRIKKVYKTGANVSKKSPKGILTGGTVGSIYARASTVFEPYTPEAKDDFWSQDNVFGRFPATPLQEALSKPDFTRTYHIIGEVAKGQLTTGADNRPRGNVTITDDTVNKELAKAMRGGMFLFLPDDAVTIGALPVGSRVEALVDGYARKNKDKNGNFTGDSNVAWSIHAIRVLLDLSDQQTIPDPTKAAVSIPKAAVERKKLI